MVGTRSKKKTPQYDTERANIQKGRPNTNLEERTIKEIKDIGIVELRTKITNREEWKNTAEKIKRYNNL